MHFLKFYQNFVFSILKKNACSTEKPYAGLWNYSDLYLLQGFGVCVLLKQTAGKMPFSGKGFATLWLNEFSGGAQCWGRMEEQEGEEQEQ